jgi:hypothetical protein
MAAKLKIEKRGDEIKKKSSPLKLLSQSQPNFAEMILGWSSWEIPIKIFLSETICSIRKKNLMKYSLDGSLPKMCPAVRPFDQDGPHSRT